MTDSTSTGAPGEHGTGTEGDPPAATSSSLEQADGEDDDLEPRGEQGGPNDAA